MLWHPLPHDGSRSSGIGIVQCSPSQTLRVLSGGLGSAGFAVQIMSVAVGWQVYDLTRNPLDLGFVGLAQFLPALLLVLVTGLIADKFNRRLIIGLCLFVEVACAFGLLVFTLSAFQACVADFCDPGGIWHGAGLHESGCRCIGTQSFAQDGIGAWHFAQFHDLADHHHHGAGCGRLALRNFR